MARQEQITYVIAYRKHLVAIANTSYRLNKYYQSKVLNCSNMSNTNRSLFITDSLDIKRTFVITISWAENKIIYGIYRHIMYILITIAND